MEINNLVVALISMIFGGLIVFLVIRRSEISEDNFVVNYNVLLNVIEIYKESILTGKISVLQVKYNLDERSAVNSRLAFEKAKNELISEAAKEIMKGYLSDKCLSSLLRHYSVDSLSLLIITHLKR